jgi:hypothetical protein
MIFRSFTHFLGIYLFISGILKKEKRFGHGLGARPTSRPGQLWLWRVASTQSAVTVAATGAAARPVAARRWPRWEEVASTSKRGPRSMRHARRGGMGLTEVAQHH